MGKVLEMNFKVPAQVRHEDGRFFATCFLVETRHDAPSKSEALAKLSAAVRLRMGELIDARTFDRMLAHHALRAHGSNETFEAGPYIEVAVALKG
jgi:hypothetical protein